LWCGLGGPGAIYGVLSERAGSCYAVWGLEAIEFRYVDDRGKEKMIRIGTNVADGLDSALTAARSEYH
jgi:hypothetical protein